MIVDVKDRRNIIVNDDSEIPADHGTCVELFIITILLLLSAILIQLKTGQEKD